MSAASTRPLAVAIAATLALGLVKLVAAVMTGSHAVLASAADSIGDAAVSGMNLALLRVAQEPPDAGHPFGHGKAEALAGLVQGTVLAVAVLWIANNAVNGLLDPRPPDVGPAVAIMLGSTAGSFAISHWLSRAAQRTGSFVLLADATHYRMDVWSGAAVVTGLVAVSVTGYARADPLASLLVVGLMAKDVAKLLRESIGELMDRPLSVTERKVIETALRSVPDVRSWHDLRTRRSGDRRFVQVHVVLPATLSFSDAHRASAEVERSIQLALPGCEVLVHTDVEGEEE